MDNSKFMSTKQNLFLKYELWILVTKCVKLQEAKLIADSTMKICIQCFAVQAFDGMMAGIHLPVKIGWRYYSWQSQFLLVTGTYFDAHACMMTNKKHRKYHLHDYPNWLASPLAYKCSSSCWCFFLCGGVVLHHLAIYHCLYVPTRRGEEVISNSSVNEQQKFTILL